ncbi:MAG: Dabb family protein [Vicinamibacterales bacterium]
MLLHIVLFRPKPGISESDRAAMFAALNAAASEIADVRRFQVGARVTHGAVYEKLMSHDFPFAAIIEFDDLAGLQSYLRHPAHVRLAELFYTLQEAALAYDYDVNPLSAEGATIT